MANYNWIRLNLFISFHHVLILTIKTCSMLLHVIYIYIYKVYILTMEIEYMDSFTKKQTFLYSVTVDILTIGTEYRPFLQKQFLAYSIC